MLFPQTKVLRSLFYDEANFTQTCSETLCGYTIYQLLSESFFINLLYFSQIFNSFSANTNNVSILPSYFTFIEAQISKRRLTHNRHARHSLVNRWRFIIPFNRGFGMALGDTSGKRGRAQCWIEYLYCTLCERGHKELSWTWIRSWPRHAGRQAFFHAYTATCS